MEVIAPPHHNYEKTSLAIVMVNALRRSSASYPFRKCNVRKGLSIESGLSMGFIVLGVLVTLMLSSNKLTVIEVKLEGK